MNLVLLLAAAMAAFALFHFWAVPAARSRMRRATGRGAIAAAGMFALADVCRSIIFLVALAALACLLLIAFAELAGVGNLGQVEAAVQMVVRWRALLEEISPVLSAVIAAVCGLGLLLLGRRAAQTKVAGLLAAADWAEAEQIFEQLKSGSAQPLPDTADMADLRSKLTTIEAQITELKQAAGSEQDQQRKVALDRQLGERRQLMDTGIIALLRMDIDRRRAPPKPVGDFVPAPGNRWERIQDIVFSRGMLGMMGGASRLVFAVAMFLMVPSLLAVNTVAVGVDLRQIEIRLSAIEMKLEGKAAQQQFAQAAAAGPTPAAEPQIGDEQALNELARLYDQGIALHYVRVAHLADQHVSNARLSATRERILSSALSQRPADHAALASLDGAAHSPADRLYLELAQPQPPLSPEAARFREELRREVMQKQPDLWRKMKSRVEGLAHSFTTPLDRGMLRGMMVARVASAGLDVGHVLPPELSSIGSGIEGSVAEDAYRIRSRKFLAGVMSAPTGDATVKAIDDGWVPPPTEIERDRAVARRVPEANALEQRLAAEPPRFPAFADAHAVEASRLTNALMADSPRSAERFSDALATFEDFFPGHVGAERATARGLLLEAHNIKPAVPSNVLARMAGNFRLLRGFSRIGGVLIGQDAMNGDKPLDFVDVSWKTVPEGIALTFRRSDGIAIDLEPSPASLVAQALTYAADGRPVTATMTRATPLKDLKILAHPTLVDTGMGCRAIEIDRFVDTFLSEDPRGEEVKKNVTATLWEIDLYNFAQRAFSIGYIEHFRVTEQVIKVKRALAEEFDWLRGIVKLDQIDVGAMFDPQRSPLTTKKEFFEPNVVRGLSVCLAVGDATVDTIGQCMIDSGKKFSRDLPGIFDEATEFIPWSGVREREWSLDPDLAFAKSGLADDRLYPFEFVEQLAALGPANFAPDEDAYVDPKPFTFPAYQQLISEVVIRGVDGDSAAREILADMRHFTLLERVFRAALAGQLGAKFPVERLAVLADATKAAVKETHTPRWTPHPGMLEREYLLRMGAVANALEAANDYGDLVKQERACLAALGSKNLLEVAAIPDSTWGEICDLREVAKRHPEFADNPQQGTAARAAWLVSLSAQLRDARKLRETMGVPAEEQAMRMLRAAGGPVCPPL